MVLRTMVDVLQYNIRHVLKEVSYCPRCGMPPSTLFSLPCLTSVFVLPPTEKGQGHDHRVRLGVRVDLEIWRQIFRFGLLDTVASDQEM